MRRASVQRRTPGGTRRSSRTCTSTRSTRAPAAGTSTCRTSPGGPGARASPCSAPATSPTPPGTTTCARRCARPSPACSGSPRTRERDIARRLPPRLASEAETTPVRFMLSVEISTIYKRDDRTRKVHHLIYLPDLDAVGAVQHRARAGSATSARTAGRSSAWTPATCWRSPWRPARTATWCRRTSGRRGSPRWARSPASTRSPTATPTWPSTSSPWRPGCPPTRR